MLGAARVNSSKSHEDGSRRAADAWHSVAALQPYCTQKGKRPTVEWERFDIRHRKPADRTCQTPQELSNVIRFPLSAASNYADFFIDLDSFGIRRTIQASPFQLFST